MIIELEINGARVIVSGDNLTVSVTDAHDPAPHADLPLPTASLIAALRSVLKMSQGDLAGHLGVSQAAVCRWENGDREPRGPMALRLAKMITKHNARLGVAA